jgi:membrane fusion protein, multidrug efflux system
MTAESAPESPGEEAPPPRSTRSRRRWWIALLLVLAIVGASVAANQWSQRSARAAKRELPAPRPIPVVAVAAKQGDINVYLTGLGSVTPLNTVTVKSRVDGQIVSVRFREGDIVKRGDLLAEIDPRPFQVQLTQAEGQMAKDRASLDNARTDLARYQVLYQQGFIPKQQLDTQASLVHQFEGTIEADQGQIDNARLQLTYCRIVAPIGGRLGLRLVDEGNVVHASDTTGLVVITQLQPITVVFTIAEDSLPSLLAKVRAGGQLRVDAFDRAQKQLLATGSLLTLDNQIDPNTGTVKLKAQFPNVNNELFPSQFVNARLLLEIKNGVTLVPAAAIQRGAQGPFIDVVKADHTVEVRPVTLGDTEGDEVSISKGVSPGELVVTGSSPGFAASSPVSLGRRCSCRRSRTYALADAPATLSINTPCKARAWASSAPGRDGWSSACARCPRWWISTAISRTRAWRRHS